MMPISFLWPRQGRVSASLLAVSFSTNHLDFSLLRFERLPFILHDLTFSIHRHMFSGFQTMTPTDGDLATQALKDEGTYRFERFDASEAVTLGLSIRKRFRQSSRHKSGAGKGLAISIQTIAGHILFACTVGDLGHPSGIGDISLDSWACIEGMVSVVKRTGHSSFYVEKGMSAMGKTPKQLGMGMQGDFRVNGGAFPIWLENAPCCPIAVAACYSGSSHDDHHLVATTIRDYLNKIRRGSMTSGPPPTMPIPELQSPKDWQSEIHMMGGTENGYPKRSETPYDENM